MNEKRCPNCRLVNFPHSPACVRCRRDLIEVSANVESVSLKSKVLQLASVCVVVCLLTLAGFYLSMIFTASPLSGEERAIKASRAKFFCSGI